ncbi:DUF488 domain-containing protein [Nordella sp. HKS 07]|uniref:DUF488 domain-containing protein n=1 Tax=Nordella sp. HKS 07 TaxID=2712222 RepID=UPI0013E20426|nr:DUF488 domain-containing protein [Nordella sp. HKS 07]QIG49620.1 DUF488 domain-containing protein [Nordella sp. HKS 07]
MMDKTVEVLTIGHSTQSVESFIQLLRQAGVTAMADVRSVPFSRHVPQFNREALKQALAAEKIAYVYLGDELGGRPKTPELFSDGVADYEKMAQIESFTHGLDRVIEGSRTHRIALMCAERDPLDCHRCLLIGRALKEKGVSVRHILGSGETIGQDDIEQLLLAMAHRSHRDLFTAYEDRIAQAYRDKARRAAFSERPAQAGKNDQFRA